MNNSSHMNSRPRLIELPKVNDPRGNLTFVESEGVIPFKIERNYWVYDVPCGKWRTGHAFRKQREFIIALSGSFDVVLNDGTGETRYHLARPHIGLYVPEMTWRSLDNFSTNSVALVLSSTRFDQNDYIENFDEFISEKK